jgi:SAM-dependent methyltransferase
VNVEIAAAAPGYADAAAPAAGHATRCVWCGAGFGPGSKRLEGRIRCGACGAATTDPWPTEQELEAAYGGWYRPKAERWSEPNESGTRFSFGGDAVLARTRGLLAARLDEIAPPGPILDVGAGEGTLVDALEARGREVLGLERGSARSDFAEAAIEQVGGDGTWAGIVFWHALEHLPRPGAAVAATARLLKPGGVVAIAVPNNASLQARAFGAEWLHLDLPRHLAHLSDESLSAGLARHGIRVERVSYSRGGQIVVGWLDGLVGRLPGGLDLYAAIRRPEARSERLSPARRLLSVLAGVVLLPLAAACAAVEIALRRGGTVYVEGRRV